MTATGCKMIGPPMAPNRKQLTRSEIRTPKGRFAVHLQSLMDNKGMSPSDLARLCRVGQPTVRKWLRAESVPETLDLEKIGKSLGLPDYRMVLPPSE